ncbi:hypothetical protein [Paenarthrobacter sp. NPDC090522]|uniref:hypothetical protein n=1 Tax=Paenarthrobacter sp. NPDC090522 TaxID=3364383 RepID=UPI00381391D4
MTPAQRRSQLLWIFENELLFQTRHALHAIEPIKGSLFSDNEVKDLEGFWFSMNSALNAIASIANVLWPSQDRKHSGPTAVQSSSRDRAKIMRENLGLSDDSIVALRGVRNGLAHYDERVDRWFVQSGNRIFLDLCVSGNDGVSAEPDTTYARHFNTDTKVLSVFGISLNVEAVLQEIIELNRVVESSIFKPRPGLIRRTVIEGNQ